ncbi:BtaManbiosPhlase [Sporolactobacillus putidus]|uniref:Glycosidase n=1 Tax=Sporolactobacillus putidus TaxID=492735 RepID=A0A917S4A4_9BACL|nr:glycoside hydrolase family 130 protein [Sporolactobacillus putidus]GGL56603.1 glycosidase [Sporolactobacillus putidus]
MVTVKRYLENPLITPEEVKPYHDGFEVIGAFNAGVAQYEDEIMLLLRIAERPLSGDPLQVPSPYYNIQQKCVQVHFYDRRDPAFNFKDSRVIKRSDQPDSFCGLTSLSYFRLARSRDGHHFSIDDKPFIYPSNRYQTFGVEDSRITQIGDTYYIYFSAVSEVGIGVNMVSTKDFKTFQDHGLIFSPENKDVVIFPEKINGCYYALHRPSLKSVGTPDIWIAESDNLDYWGNHRHLLGVRKGRWDGGRIGSGAVPIKTQDGWLEIYHGMSADSRYCLGGLLLDLNDPSKILARSDKPILEPEAEYEKKGFFGEVVFTCGGIVQGQILKLYYGVSDRSMACAELDIDEILSELKNSVAKA